MSVRGLVASFAACVRELALEQMTALHTGAPIPIFRSAAPLLAARSSMSGASWPGRTADCVIDERARPWSRRSPRTLR
jgi:hypothetical protein